VIRLLRSEILPISFDHPFNPNEDQPFFCCGPPFLAFVALFPEAVLNPSESHQPIPLVFSIPLLRGALKIFIIPLFSFFPFPFSLQPGKERDCFLRQAFRIQEKSPNGLPHSPGLCFLFFARLWEVVF